MHHILHLAGDSRPLCPIGLGTAGILRWHDGSVADVLGTFLDCGGQVVDTARIYGYPRVGASEEALGLWLAQSGRRQDVLLMSKGGHPHVHSMHRPRMRQKDMASDLEESLRALRTDCIDVYFYHRDDESQTVGELLECMEDFRREGKIRFYGCSNWSVERMRAADEYAREHGCAGFIGNEALYNIASDHMKPLPDDTMRKADGAMRAYHACAAGNILMPYSALCEGYFHQVAKGGVLSALALSRSPYDTPENRRLAQRIHHVQEKRGATVTQVLAGFYLAQPLPMLPLFGCGSPAHVRDLMGALELPFAPEDFHD